MSAEISLFSGYSQKENRTTNYCLLVLKLIYEENPKFLGEFFTALIGEELSGEVGVQFRQQAKKASSVPDGLIVQKPFTVYIETKLFDWFHSDQLYKHLDSLDKETPGKKVLLALSKFEAGTEESFRDVENLCQSTYEGRIFFAACSFEDFLDALPRDNVSKNLSDTLDDFERYLAGADLLPRWSHLLDVVNCGRTSPEVIKHQVYLCPAGKGAYNHQRAKYLGVYQHKNVSHIALVEAVVDIKTTHEKVLWKHVDTDDSILTNRAKSILAKIRPNVLAHRVFLLGPLHSTNFKKDTKRGKRRLKLAKESKCVMMRREVKQNRNKSCLGTNPPPEKLNLAQARVTGQAKRR